MKKRLLITSIVMMLVVAVALSTATYAWFTSNASVTATSLTMNAAINQAPALEISYVNTEGSWLTTIAATPDTPTGGFKPSAPATLALHGDNVTGTNFTGLEWKSATVVNGKFNNDVSSNNEYIWHDAGNEHSSFFLHNASTANTISGITMEASISGAAASFIRIAVFKKIETNFELYGIISNGEAYTLATSYVDGTHYYTTDGVEVTLTDANSNGLADEFAAAGPLYTKSAVTSVATGNVANGSVVGTAIASQDICSTSVALGNLGVNNGTAGGTDEMELKVVVWMDGAALNDDTAGAATSGTGASAVGKVSNISLTFTAAR